MNRSRSKKGRNSQIPLFITKLLEMVENTEIESIISWTSTADAFNIKNISKFTEEVLPRYFKHRNFSSFIRQLNMYGFRKTRHIEGENVYMHENFKAGNRAQLKHINRKMREEKEERIVLYQNSQTKTDAASNREIQELKSKQKNLEQMCRHFFIQNQKLMEENQTLIKKMDNEARQRERRLEDFLIALSQRKLHSQLAAQNHPYLSITEEAFQGSQGLLPPDGGHSNESAHFKRVRSLLQQLYDTSLPDRGMDLSKQPRQSRMSQGFGFEEDDNSYMSINDFINAEDYQNQINLEESR